MLNGATPLAGATVYLDQNNSGALDTGEPNTLTNAFGEYSFSGLPEGTYTVAQVVPNGYTQISPASNPGPGSLGEILDDFEPPEPQPIGLEWAGTGLDRRLYLLRYDSGRVHTWDPATRQYSAGPVFTTSVGVIEMDYDGATFWGVDRGNAKIVQFDLNGAILQQIARPDLTQLSGITWHGGSLWVSEQATDTIQELNPSTFQTMRTIPSPDGFAWGLESDGTHLWINGFNTGRTFEIDPTNGTVLRSFAAPLIGGNFFEESGYSPMAGGIGLSYDGQSLWMAQYSAMRVFQFDTSTQGSHTVSLDGGGLHATGLDFNDAQLAAATGRVYDDLNGDGIQGAGETGLEGWRVFVDRNGDGRFHPWESSALTDASGNYSISGLKPGTHTIMEELRSPGWSATSGTSRAVTLDGSGVSAAVTPFGSRQLSFAPVGPETRVNTTTAGEQNNANGWIGNSQAVASNGVDRFAVVWHGDGPGGANGVFAKLYNAGGTVIKDEFRVNSTSASAPSMPMVAMAPNGNFVVAWFENGRGTRARLYRPDGTPITAEIYVDLYSAVSLAMDPAGNFGVLYSKDFAWRFAYEVQLYNASGRATKRVSVAPFSLMNGGASLAMGHPDGRFVVAWADDNLYAQRYDKTGKAQGAQITVAIGQHGPSVAMAADGTFAIHWYGNPDTRRARIYEPNGQVRADVTVLNAFGARQGVAFDNAGHVVLAYALPNDVYLRQGGVWLQRFSAANGQPVPGEPAARVNTTWHLPNRTAASIAPLAGESLAVSWSARNPGAADSEVYVQRFAGAPAPLRAASVVSDGSTASTLATDRVLPLVKAARRRWSRLGLNSRLLSGLQIHLADLRGDQLAEISGQTLTIDTDAAGHGWFIDPTPHRNEEFARRGARTVRIASARGRYDLLTVLTHEIGHTLGLGHTPQGVMAATLKPGVRLLPGRLGAKIGR